MKMETCFGDIVIRENTNLPHSGARVWSSSHVLTKYLEKHRRKLRIRGKVLELGAGCGMNGIMMSKIGCDTVVFTDIDCVLDHLQQNVDMNLSDSLHRKPAVVVGKNNNNNNTKKEEEEVSHTEEQEQKKYVVRELEWDNEEHMRSIRDEFGTFQFIIGSDVVYQEEHVVPLLKTLIYFTENSSSTNIIIGYEIRNDSAHELFLEMCPEYGFDVKQIPTKQQHEDYREELVLLYHLRRI